MFLYKGFNPDGGNRDEKELDDEYDAIEYARENCVNYPEYKVIDMDDDKVIDSDKMAQDELDASHDMMYPNGVDE